MRKFLFVAVCLFGLFAAGLAYAMPNYLHMNDLVASAGTSTMYAPQGTVFTCINLWPYDPTDVLATLLGSETLTVAIWTENGAGQWTLAGSLTDAIVGGGTVGSTPVHDAAMHLNLGGVRAVKLVATACVADSIACEPWLTAVPAK